MGACFISEQESFATCKGKGEVGCQKKYRKSANHLFSTSSQYLSKSLENSASCTSKKPIVFCQSFFVKIKRANIYLQHQRTGSSSMVGNKISIAALLYIYIRTAAIDFNRS